MTKHEKLLAVDVLEVLEEANIKVKKVVHYGETDKEEVSYFFVRPLDGPLVEAEVNIKDVFETRLQRRNDG